MFFVTLFNHKVFLVNGDSGVSFRKNACISLHLSDFFIFLQYFIISLLSITEKTGHLSVLWSGISLLHLSLSELPWNLGLSFPGSLLSTRGFPCRLRGMAWETPRECQDLVPQGAPGPFCRNGRSPDQCISF